MIYILMVLLTIKNTSCPNGFTQYLDNPLQNVSKISLLSAVINFSNNSIPDEICILCQEISSDRLYNGIKSPLLILINKRSDNQIVFETRDRMYIDLASRTLPLLTVSVVDIDYQKITNIQSIYLDLEIV